MSWEVAFPGVWENWDTLEPAGGFDASSAIRPGTGSKLQEVEWFAARKPEIARQSRAADRNRMVEDLQKQRPAYSRLRAGKLACRNCFNAPARMVNIPLLLQETPIFIPYS
ncbi:MAG: hypothetical protein IPH04_19760 [Saprospirales bacterium]|nr:hypothetical protein [Saprospirales bacterium]